MRERALFFLRRYVLRETTLTHVLTLLALVTAVGFSAILAIAPQGTTTPAPAAGPGVEPPFPAVTTLPEIESPAPEPPRQAVAESSRGDRAVSSLSIAPDPTPALPSPTAEALPIAAPAPTAVPTQVPTAAPAQAAAPAREPVVMGSALSQLRVGLQAGHWKNAELPAELASLRGSTGAMGSGWREVDVNLAVAQKVAALLKARGILVDLIPATVPVAYKANAFVSIHGDANGNTSLSGYKLARATWSTIPQQEDALLRAVSSEYAAATGLKDHPSTITANMRQYYAFNWRRLQHAVAPTTPSVILELGFLTTPSDRKLMLEQQDRLAEGISNGIVRFLSSK